MKIDRVFMFANYTPCDSSVGITKKIRSEICTLRDMGMQVFYTGYEESGISIFDNSDSVVFYTKYPTKSALINKKLRYYLLERTAIEYLSKDACFSLGYIRLGPPNAKLMTILKKLKNSGTHIVIESLAYFPGIQYKSLGGKYITLMHKLHSSEFKNYIDYFLVEGNMTEMYGVKAFTMNMGVDVDNIAPHTYKGETEKLNLISVANENVYHAYDRIIKSLNVWLQKKPEDKIQIHLVGTISDQTKVLIGKSNLFDHVILYGKKSGPELDEIYNKCNIGLGPLGQHRVGGKKDTGLKTKEYFAKGLPYIYSGEEPTVPQGYPYIHCFPSDDSMIDFDEVRYFYDSFKGSNDIVESMRRFAKETYSWDKIMNDALSHL